MRGLGRHRRRAVPVVMPQRYATRTDAASDSTRECRRLRRASLQPGWSARTRADRRDPEVGSTVTLLRCCPAALTLSKPYSPSRSDSLAQSRRP